MDLGGFVTSTPVLSQIALVIATLLSTLLGTWVGTLFGVA